MDQYVTQLNTNVFYAGCRSSSVCIAYKVAVVVVVVLLLLNVHTERNN